MSHEPLVENDSQTTETLKNLTTPLLLKLVLTIRASQTTMICISLMPSSARTSASHVLRLVILPSDIDLFYLTLGYEDMEGWTPVHSKNKRFPAENNSITMTWGVSRSITDKREQRNAGCSRVNTECNWASTLLRICWVILRRTAKTRTKEARSTKSAGTNATWCKKDGNAILGLESLYEHNWRLGWKLHNGDSRNSVGLDFRNV